MTQSQEKCVFQHFYIVLDHQEKWIFQSNFYSLFEVPFLTFQVPNFYESSNSVPFSIFMVFIKAPFGGPFHHKRRKIRSSPNDPGCPSSDPAFRETIVITMPLGPSGFLKVIFPTAIGSFSVFPASLCAMFYIYC